MLVVSNTSPLSNLAIIDQLELLRSQLHQILVPPAVRRELNRLSHPAARSRLDLAFQEGWLRESPLLAPVPIELSSALDLGEAEALSLALQSRASLVLLDESCARQQASQRGLPHTGVLGVLRRAKQSGRIPSLEAEIRRLRHEARFFIHPALEKRLLASVGE